MSQCMNQLTLNFSSQEAMDKAFELYFKEKDKLFQQLLPIPQDLLGIPDEKSLPWKPFPDMIVLTHSTSHGPFTQLVTTNIAATREYINTWTSTDQSASSPLKETILGIQRFIAENYIEEDKIEEYMAVHRKHTNKSVLKYLEDKLREDTLDEESVKVVQYLLQCVKAHEKYGFHYVGGWCYWNWGSTEEAEFAYEVKTGLSLKLCFYTDQEQPIGYISALYKTLLEIDPNIQFSLLYCNESMSVAGHYYNGLQVQAEEQSPYLMHTLASSISDPELYLDIKEQMGFC